MAPEVNFFVIEPIRNTLSVSMGTCNSIFAKPIAPLNKVSPYFVTMTATPGPNESIFFQVLMNILPVLYNSLVSKEVRE